MKTYTIVLADYEKARFLIMNATQKTPEEAAEKTEVFLNGKGCPKKFIAIAVYEGHLKNLLEKKIEIGISCDIPNGSY
jgi:hypothetical protein